MVFSVFHPQVITMAPHLILASGSQIRATILSNAGLVVDVRKPLVDEETIKMALLQEKAPPRDIADCLAEAKARKVSQKNPEALVLGCDQVLDHQGQILSKAASSITALIKFLKSVGGPILNSFTSSTTFSMTYP